MDIYCCIIVKIIIIKIERKSENKNKFSKNARRMNKDISTIAVGIYKINNTS